MKIIYSNNNQDPKQAKLIEGLVKDNNNSGPPENSEWMALYAEDDEGKLLGGIHCQFEWDYLVVKRLWVADKGKGLGSRLLKEAEKLALQKEKRGVWLDTFEFQARKFYEKHGYLVFGTIPDAADDYDRYFLFKRF